jgi:ketosteroid isomerase-like protein
MNLQLPESIGTYFDVSNRNDGALITECFTENAVVFDEGGAHQGHTAIQSWFQETRKKYEYRVEPVSISGEDDNEIVVAKVIGNFPGSPIQLHYAFLLQGNKIQTLEIY